MLRLMNVCGFLMCRYVVVDFSALERFILLLALVFVRFALYFVY